MGRSAAVTRGDGRDAALSRMGRSSTERLCSADVRRWLSSDILFARSTDTAETSGRAVDARSTLLRFADLLGLIFAKKALARDGERTGAATGKASSGARDLGIAGSSNESDLRGGAAVSASTLEPGCSSILDNAGAGATLAAAGGEEE